jgi:ferredoxin-NADP reductase
VKKIGTVSSQLVAMKRGDTLIASLPLGSFYSKSQSTPLIMIAAGISVTPFHSMILDNIEKNSSRKLVLFYSNQTIANIVFKKQFDDLATLHPQFQVHYFITREKTTLPGITNGRMTSKSIVNSISDIRGAEFFICGSGDFVHSLRHSLITEGVLRSAIHTESFPRISLAGTLKRVFNTI